MILRMDPDTMESTQVPPEIPDEAMNFMQQCLIKEPFNHRVCVW